MPRSPGLSSAPSPVHGELGHKGDIVGPGGRWLMGQESDMHTVHSELLLPELKAGLFLAELCQGPLQLRGSRGEGPEMGQHQSPDQAGSHQSREGQSVPVAREGGSLSPARPRVRVGWGTQRALSATDSHHTPGRSGRSYGRIPRACSSRAASLASSSGSPGTQEGVSGGMETGLPSLAHHHHHSAPPPPFTLRSAASE